MLNLCNFWQNGWQSSRRCRVKTILSANLWVRMGNGVRKDNPRKPMFWRKFASFGFRSCLGVAAAVLWLCLGCAAPSAAADKRDPSLFELTLEELLDVVVSSPRKTEQGILDSPVAITVITAEQIRLSGTRSLPEALSLAPGVYVMRSDGNSWNVTIGGFGLPPFSSNKLLVLVDGVTVYSTLSGNVEWDFLPVSLQEVARIEVIRGPGGVLYGANAVNGVISIVTGRGNSVLRQEVGSQKLLLTSASTVLEAPSGRFGGLLSVGHEEDYGLGGGDGNQIRDSQRLNTAAAKTETRVGPDLRLSVDGRYKGGEYRTESTPGIDRRKIGVGILRARLDASPESANSWWVQVFGRRQTLYDEEGTLGETVWDEREDGQVLDLEFQGSLPTGGGPEPTLTFGGGYRLIDDAHEILLEGGQSHTVKNLYLHQTWRPGRRWKLEAGIKWEDTELVAATFPWSVSLLRSLGEGRSFRLAVSTAYRSPTLLESFQEIVFYPGAGIFGNPDLKPEEVLTWEAGYRGALGSRLYLDLAVARKFYEDIIAQYEVPPEGSLLYRFKNDGSADALTADMGLDAVLSSVLRGRIVYGFVDVAFEGPDASKIYQEGSQVRGFGRLDLTWVPGSRFRANLAGNYRSGVAGTTVKERWMVDLNLARTMDMGQDSIEIGVTGTNIFRSEVPESAGTSSGSRVVPRVVSIYCDYRF